MATLEPLRDLTNREPEGQVGPTLYLRLRPKN